jgi:hypothetical protein
LFGNFDETKQGKAKVAKQSVVELGNRCKMNLYVELWVGTQYDCKD